MAGETTAFWIFGYGSLMWDGWEQRFGCMRREVAVLRDHRRVFNKASIVRWGSVAAPGPTLNVESALEARCTGFAFAFSPARVADVLSYLTEREGFGFQLRERRIELSPAESVDALVPVYEGTDLLDSSVTVRAAMACCAAGSGGRCIDYVRNIAARLAELHIHDPAVAELLEAVEASERKRASVP